MQELGLCSSAVPRVFFIDAVLIVIDITTNREERVLITTGAQEKCAAVNCVLTDTA